MSCRPCDAAALDLDRVYPIRVGVGVVEVRGCEKHVAELVRLLRLGTPELVSDQHAIVAGWVAGCLSKGAGDLFPLDKPVRVQVQTDPNGNYRPVVHVGPMAGGTLYRVIVEQVVG